MVMGEAGIIGVMAALYGVVVGLLLAFILVYVIDRQSFGWAIALQIPVVTLLEAMIVVVAAALCGGVYPASVAARIRTDEAVRSE